MSLSSKQYNIETSNSTMIELIRLISVDKEIVAHLKRVCLVIIYRYDVYEVSNGGFSISTKLPHNIEPINTLNTSQQSLTFQRINHNS